MSLNYTPRTWTPALVTVAMLNAEIRDPLTGLQAANESYTPVLTATTTNPTMNNSTIDGRFKRVGKTILDLRITLVIGSSFAVGAGAYLFSLPPGLPPVANNTGDAMGTAIFRDVSPVTTKGFTAYLASGVSNTIALLQNDNQGLFGAASPVVPASGDRVSIIINSYETSAS